MTPTAGEYFVLEMAGGVLQDIVRLETEDDAVAYAKAHVKYEEDENHSYKDDDNDAHVLHIFADQHGRIIIDNVESF